MWIPVPFVLLSFYIACRACGSTMTAEAMIICPELSKNPKVWNRIWTANPLPNTPVVTGYLLLCKPSGRPLTFEQKRKGRVPPRIAIFVGELVQDEHGNKFETRQQMREYYEARRSDCNARQVQKDRKTEPLFMIKHAVRHAPERSPMKELLERIAERPASAPTMSPQYLSYGVLPFDASLAMSTGETRIEIGGSMNGLQLYQGWVQLFGVSSAKVENTWARMDSAWTPHQRSYTECRVSTKEPYVPGTKSHRVLKPKISKHRPGNMHRKGFSF